MNNTCQCHNTCKKLAKSNAARAAGVAAVLSYRQQNGVLTYVMGAGLETGGTYQGQYNMCSGKGENTDTNRNGEYCWLETVKRELKEEFKIDAPFNGGVFNFYFKNSQGRIRFFIHNRTPIFIAVLPNGTSRQPIKLQMQQDCNNFGLSHSYKEMIDFEWVRLDNGLKIDGTQIGTSTYLDAVRRKINVNSL